MMGTWKVLFLAMKVRRGWNRIPPKQRRRLIEGAREQVRKQGPVVAQRVRERGPVVAKRIGETITQGRKRP
jgi:ribosomal protein S30